MSRVTEARRLRQAGFSEPILLLGGVDPEDYAEVVRLSLTSSVSDWSTADGLASAAHAAGETVGVHVKVDTGITRYGAPQDEAMAIVRGLSRLESLRLEGFYTHFAAAACRIAPSVEIPQNQDSGPGRRLARRFPAGARRARR